MKKEEIIQLFKSGKTKQDILDLGYAKSYVSKILNAYIKKALLEDDVQENGGEYVVGTPCCGECPGCSHCSNCLEEIKGLYEKEQLEQCKEFEEFKDSEVIKIDEINQFEEINIEEIHIEKFEEIEKIKFEEVKDFRIDIYKDGFENLKKSLVDIEEVINLINSQKSILERIAKFLSGELN